MKVLLWHVHGSWTTAFVQGGHEYLIPVVEGRGPDGLGRARTWDWPANAREVTPEMRAKFHYSWEGYVPEVHRLLADNQLLFPGLPAELTGRLTLPGGVSPAGAPIEVQKLENGGWVTAGGAQTLSDGTWAAYPSMSQATGTMAVRCSVSDFRWRA